MKLIQKILKICNNKPVSLEVFADEQRSMLKQGLKINSWEKMSMLKFL